MLSSIPLQNGLVDMVRQSAELLLMRVHLIGRKEDSLALQSRMRRIMVSVTELIQQQRHLRLNYVFNYCVISDLA